LLDNGMHTLHQNMAYMITPMFGFVIVNDQCKHMWM